MSYQTTSSDEPRRMHNVVWIVGVLACYVALCYAARTWVYSLSGWIVLGLAPALLLDKVVFRILSPPETESRLTQIGIRCGYLVLGMAGFFTLIDGKIEPAEALLLGAVLSLVTFLFEFGLEWAYYLASWIRPSRTPERPGPLRLTLMAALIAFPLVLLHPLMTVHPVRRVPVETPFELGLAFDEFEFETADGIHLAGWYVPAEKARATVIYCHGYGENRGQSLSLLEPLNRMGINVLAFDFRGHGNSDGHTVTFGYREHNDLLAAYAEAKRRAPGSPLFIVGISYGAVVSLQNLTELPDVRGVWADSTFGRWDSILERGFGFVPESARPAVVSLSNAMLWLDCGFWGQDLNPIESLKKVRVPIYFCHGKADLVTSFEEGQAVYNAYQGPKWCYWVDDGTHLSLSDKAQCEYFLRLRKFIKDHLPE